MKVYTSEVYATQYSKSQCHCPHGYVSGDHGNYMPLAKWLHNNSILYVPIVNYPGMH